MCNMTKKTLTINCSFGIVLICSLLSLGIVFAIAPFQISSMYATDDSDSELAPCPDGTYPEIDFNGDPVIDPVTGSVVCVGSPYS